MQGTVIGINNAIYSPSGGSVGIGFAIPAEVANPIVRSLIAGEEIERGFIGVDYQPITNPDVSASLGLPKNVGVLIGGVREGEPADRAGLQIGDVITKVDGEDITPENGLPLVIGNLPPGTTITAVVLRDGRLRNVDITLAQRPPNDELEAPSEEPFDPEAEPESGPQSNASLTESLGLSLGVMDAAMARRLGVDTDTRGLWVDGIDRSSEAAQRLSRGSIILSANNQTVNTVADLETVVAAARKAGRDAVLLRVLLRDPRGSRYTPPRFVALPIRD